MRRLARAADVALRGLAAGVLALPMLLLSGCRGGEPRAPAGTPVVLISIDTLRADHLPAYGYRGVETPAIDSLRRDGVLFERAFTHTPLTLPSHTALLTGMLPADTGVRDNVGYRLDPGRVDRGELPFLPRILKAHGYATGAAVSAYVLQARTGLGTGFDFYEDSIEFKTGTGLGGLQRPGRETLRLAIPWLRSVAARPFFLFFHLYEPHTPYEPEEPFASRYPLKYDGEIATADRVVGGLLEELRRLGVYDRALIVLLSDHGEGLGDHGEAEHGLLLYNEAIHVPLLLKLPSSQLAGSSAAAPAQLTDVVPTLLALLRLPLPPRLRGSSLLRLLAPGASAPARRVYSETFYPRLHFGWSDLASLVDRRYHYIEGPDPELYDLARDPHERENLLGRERRTFAEMRREMTSYDRRLAPPSAVDEETKRAMTALGYVSGGSGVGAGSGAAGPLPDPKTQLGTLADLKEGFAAVARHQDQAAAAIFERVVSAHPGMGDAWEFLALARQRQGDSGGALAAYARALRLQNGSPHLAIAMASLYFERGELAEAETHARLALAANPSFAHGLLAQIALRRKDLATAEREARLAMEDKGLRIGPMITLAEVLQARGRLEEAMAAARRAEQVYAERSAKDPELIRGLALVQGKILADLGDAAAAEAAFNKEIALFPQDLRAYPNLAILLALTGRTADARASLERMIAVHPSAAAYAEVVKTYRALRDPASASAVLRYALARYPGSPDLRGLSGDTPPPVKR